MRPSLRSSIALLATIVVVALARPGFAFGATSDQLVTLAETYKLGCAGDATQQTCTGSPFRVFWTAVITPGTGQLATLGADAAAVTIPLDSNSASWMGDMQGTGCGDPAGAAAYVGQVAALTKAGSVAKAIVGECTMSGDLTLDANGGSPVYHVGSIVNPKATPKPTLKPTPKPTIKPTPIIAPPTATPSPSATPETASPSPSPTESIAAPATILPGEPAPTASPALAPVGLVAEPPSSPAPSGSGGESAFAASIADFTDVDVDPLALGGSALLALLLLLIVGFPAELFNNTIENNYDEISGWFKRGRIGRINGWLGSHRRLAVVGFVALTALVSSLTDPTFGVSAGSAAEFGGFLVGLLIVLASFKLPPMLAHRSKTGDFGQLRPLPWALAIAALFVLVSRVANLQPGYLYGIVLGAVFSGEVSDREEGRESFAGSLWTFGAAVVSWVLLAWVRGLGLPSGDLFGIFATTGLAAILVAGLEATAFGLMPLRFMPGHSVYRWNRLAWAVLFGLSVFAFVHILIAPGSGYISDLSLPGFIAAAGIFAAFGALSVLTWGYFRFRPAPGAANEEI